jgi:large subunit ribosomal protein L9
LHEIIRRRKTMEVILIKDIEKLGYANEIVNVKPGYANNYLIPQGYAKAATASAKKVLAENLKQRAHKDAKILADAQALAEKIANLPLTIVKKAEEGKIFGAVTAAELADALAAKGVEVDRKAISVDAVKSVGDYEASAKLHREVKATIKFTVVAEE